MGNVNRNKELQGRPPFAVAVCHPIHRPLLFFFSFSPEVLSATMLALHIALYAITGTCFAFSVIELGLCAYVVAVFTGSRTESYYDFLTGNEVSQTVHVSTPGILAFLVFSAVWSMLVSVVGLGLPSLLTSKGKATVKLNSILGVIFAVLYGVTWVFWLACFADIAANLDGITSYNDYLNAVIAFAVLLWYIYPFQIPY